MLGCWFSPGVESRGPAEPVERAAVQRSDSNRGPSLRRLQTARAVQAARPELVNQGLCGAFAQTEVRACFKKKKMQKSRTAKPEASSLTGSPGDSCLLKLGERT